MEGIATASMRRCLAKTCTGAGALRSKASLINGNPSLYGLKIGNISSSRSLSTRRDIGRISPYQTISLSTISQRTHFSSLLGTIAKGADDQTPSTQNILAPPDHLNDNETAIYEMLMRELQCTRLDVKDISGGCGSMYGIEVESEKFRGLNMLKQQRLVNQVLKEKMDSENWHGVQLRTAVPAK